jgi:hypothetical protein
MSIMYLIECEGCDVRMEPCSTTSEAGHRAKLARWERIRPGYLNPGWHCPRCLRIRKAELPKPSRTEEQPCLTT